MRDLLADADDTVMDDEERRAMNLHDDLTPGQKAIIREAARAIVIEIVPELIASHQDGCVHGKRLLQIVAYASGISTVIGVLCGLLVAVATRLGG